jgi:nitrite reductase (NADH) small subunit
MTATTTGHVVGRADEVPVGEGRAFTAGGASVAVFRLRDGSLRAVAAACPHAGARWPTARPTCASWCARCT